MLDRTNKPIRLEYSFKDGSLHFSNILDSYKKDNGYYILYESIPLQNAIKIEREILDKFPNLENRMNKNYPSFKIIKEECDKIFVNIIKQGTTEM